MQPRSLRLLLLGAAAESSLIPPRGVLGIDLTGCWEMGASNGKPPAAGCGTAPLDKVARQTSRSQIVCK